MLHYAIISMSVYSNGTQSFGIDVFKCPIEHFRGEILSWSPSCNPVDDVIRLFIWPSAFYICVCRVRAGYKGHGGKDFISFTGYKTVSGFDIILYNIDGFFDRLYDILKGLVEDGFMRETCLSLLAFASTPQQVLAQLNAISQKVDATETKYI